MVQDNSDPWALIAELQRRVTRLENASPLESSAVNNGQVRFITSTLRMESGSTLILSGTLTGDGDLTWTGAWTLAGDGTISGPVDLTGDLTVLGGGQITVGGVVITPLGGGRVHVGTAMELQASESGGAVVFDSGAKITSDHSGNGVEISSTGGWALNVGSNGYSLRSATGAPMVSGSSDGLALVSDSILTPLLPPLPSGHGYDLVVRSLVDGRLYRFSGGTGGGPGDGIFAWPFPLVQVTSEFRSAERPNHDGIDFGIGPSNTIGTPIPSMGAGVVHRVLSVNDGTHGWGNGVVIDHGADPLYGGANIKTLYAHMNTAPVVGLGSSVTLGQTLGPIGNTGNSFGAHLHLEVWVNDVPVNPRTFMAAHGG